MLSINSPQQSKVAFKRSCLATAIAAGTALLTISLSPGVLAQQADSFVIEEVLVTARKKSESLQSVPISVSAFTAKDIAAMGMTNVTDIGILTPNLQINPNTGGNDGVVACMRGLCRTDYMMTEDPQVGIYLDGVYIGKSVGSLFDVAELERVEVLRGPQGTLYGKNTLGGAILLHTRKPTDEFGAKITGTVGNFDAKYLRAHINAPINDKLATSFSLLHKKRDAFVENTLGKDVWSEDTQAAHIAVRWLPSDTVTVDYALDWQTKDQSPLAPQISSVSNGYLSFGPQYSGDVHTDRQSKVHINGDDTFNKSDLLGHSLTVNWALGDAGFAQNLNLKSITSHRDYENKMSVNSTGTALRLIYSDDLFDYETFNQEFQLSGTAADGALDFVVGLFYFEEDGNYVNPQIMDSFGIDKIHDTDIDNKSSAIFGELNYRWTEKLSTTLGFRFTKEKRKGDVYASLTPHALGIELPYMDTSIGLFLDSSTFLPIEPPPGFDTKIETSSVSPRVAVTYDWNDDLMTYVSYARGFKSGSFSARADNPTQWGPYDDATIDSYEIGFKSHWLDRRVRLNVAAFYEDIEDMQVQINQPSIIGFSNAIRNAGQATVKGLELELRAMLTQGLELSAGYGYTDAEYDEWNDFDSAGNPTNVANDRAFEFTARNTYNVTLNYSYPLENGVLGARLDLAGQSKTRFTPVISGNDDIAQPSYDLINARLSYEGINVGNGTLGVSLWVKNLDDEEYKIGGWEFNVASTGDRAAVSQWGEPRTYGLDIVYEFGARL
ncbi:MAG: TonB-dependent receptor [Halieaceae bacterium]|nr:TonB-dependent receptor [Halieaceae bacterium]